MITTIRSVLGLALAATAALLAAPTAAWAGTGLDTGPSTGPAITHAAGPADGTVTTPANTPTPTHPDGPDVDGFTVGHVPTGVGQRHSDFTYYWEDVTFRSHVWERGPDADGAYGVDLTVKVLRGAPLTDPAALRAFLAEYHEQDPSSWREIEPGRAYLRPGAVFRFVEPGLATEVSLDDTRFPEAELLATESALRPATPRAPAR